LPIIGKPTKTTDNITRTPNTPIFYNNPKTATTTTPTTPSLSFTRFVLKDTHAKERLLFNSPRLDNVISIKIGLTLLYGDTNTGKTNTALTLCFNAINRGYNAVYYDLEHGVDPDRIEQIYKHGTWNFPFEKLIPVFRTPNKLNWTEVINDLSRILTFEKPKLLILDALTPLFLKAFYGETYNKWGVTNKRENLVYKLHDIAHENNMFILVVSHAKKMQKKDSQDVQKQLRTLASEPELFSGIGSRFQYLGKNWIYFMKVIDEKNTLHRYMVITKRKVGPDFYESKEKIEFKITNRGIE